MLRFEKAIIRQGSFALSADFEVTSGTVTAVIGPSGSGKSTLLSAVAGFLPLAEGRLFAAGEDITKLPPGDRPTSIVFQDGNLFPHLDVATNVALGLHPSGKMSGSDRDAVQAVLARVGLGNLGDRRPGELSGGQQGRAALARALLRDRPAVLLDEPFAALGPALRQEMLDLVQEVFSGRTVLMVTHAPGDARAVASETVFVDAAVAHAPVRTADLFNAPPDALRDYLGT